MTARPPQYGWEMLRLVFETAGAMTLLLAAIYALRARSPDPSSFSLVAGLGTLYLSFDEALDLHVHAADAMYGDLGWRPPPGINHFDDVLVIVIALAALGVIAWYRREVVRDSRFATLFGAGLALFALAVVVDAKLDPSRTVSWWTEEVAEFAAGMCMVLAFRLRLRELRPAAGTQVAAARPVPGTAGISPRRE